jgi:hypothetical protein
MPQNSPPPAPLNPDAPASDVASATNLTFEVQLRGHDPSIETEVRILVAPHPKPPGSGHRVIQIDVTPTSSAVSSNVITANSLPAVGKPPGSNHGGSGGG